jgi:hypothetical protein
MILETGVETSTQHRKTTTTATNHTKDSRDEDVRQPAYILDTQLERTSKMQWANNAGTTNEGRNNRTTGI